MFRFLCRAVLVAFSLTYAVRCAAVDSGVPADLPIEATACSLTGPIGATRLYSGCENVSAIVPWHGGLLAAADLGPCGAAANVRYALLWFPSEQNLSSHQTLMPGCSPITAMALFDTGVVIAFDNAGCVASQHSIQWFPDPTAGGPQVVMTGACSSVTALAAYSGGLLVAYDQPGCRQGHYIVQSYSNRNLNDPSTYVGEGISPTTAMVAYGTGALIAFNSVGGSAVQQVQYYPGPQTPNPVIASSGCSPAPAMTPYNGGIAVVFQNPGCVAGNALIWFPDGTNLGGGQTIYQDCASVAAIAADGNTFFTATTVGNGSEIDSIVHPCTQLQTPVLLAPSNGSAGIASAPALKWSVVTNAANYDLYLDTTSPPTKLIAAGIGASAALNGAISLPASNLTPGTTYYWRVAARNDVFCKTPSASSAVFSFTTAAACTVPPAFVLTSPANGATNLVSPVSLIWPAVPGASTYDVYFGSSTPPALVASGLTTPSFQVKSLAANTKYSWYVVAHSSCDATKTTFSPTSVFTSAGSCAGAGAFAPQSPATGASNVSLTPSLTWSSSANASTYDLYFGTTTPPPLYVQGLQQTYQTITGLLPSRTYYWQVVARAACDVTKSTSTAVSMFTTGGNCPAPGATTFTFVPPGSVAIGQTYVLSWKASTGLDTDGYYLVERSQSPTFNPILDSQQTFSTSASFVSTTAATYYHRVRQVLGCNVAAPGPPATASVSVASSSPNVIFTVQPRAVVASLNENLRDLHSQFTIENIGNDKVNVILGTNRINSVPFFTISDPLGGDPVFVTLLPNTPRTFNIDFSGPQTNAVGAYEGIIFVASTGPGLAVTPYAFVNLKVGNGTTVTPLFMSNGVPAETTFFPSFSGDDKNRPPITIDIRNSSSVAMDLGSEIGPDLWLVPEAGWNATAIPAGTSRTVKLYTNRERAPNGSALPRYTYFTVRSKTGQTARLLVQDNDAPLTFKGRSSLLDPGTQAFVVPGVTSTSATYSKVRLSNVANAAVQTELFFTPEGADGLDASLVKHATLLVPPNDVMTLTDPLAQLFGLARPANGQLEIRGAAEQIGSLIVSSCVTAPAASGGGFNYEIPTLRVGEGARLGNPHSIAGVQTSSSAPAALLLAETSGIEATQAHVIVYDSQGAKKGESSFALSRYSQRKIDLAALGVTGSLNGARIDLSIDSGGGAIEGIVTMLDAARSNGAVALSQPLADQSDAVSKGPQSNASSTTRSIAVLAMNGTALSALSASFKTTMSFSAGKSARSVTATYFDGDPNVSSQSRTITIPAQQTMAYDNVLETLFGVDAGRRTSGVISVDAPAGTQISAHLQALPAGSSQASQSATLPVITSASETIASKGRPLYLDGLEQSIDSSRGSRWTVLLDEISGASATVKVRLYEAGNRTRPIAEKNFDVAPNGQLRLDTVFSELGLESASRSKDRVNVQCVVTVESGSGRVVALGLTVDNETGDVRTRVFEPAGGSTASASRIVIVPVPSKDPPPAAPVRRRTIQH